MLNFRTLAIIKRELREKLLSKAFIIMTVMLPVLMFVFIGFQAWIMDYAGDSNTKIEIITETIDLSALLENEFAETEYAKDTSYTFMYNVMPKAEIENYLRVRKTDIIDESLTGVVFVPLTALSDKKIEYYSKTPKNLTVSEKIEWPINRVLTSEYFKEKNLSKEELGFARKGIDLAGFKVSKEDSFEEQGYGNLVLAYLFIFLLYISLLMMGQMTMQSVQEEKNNRIVEVLLSSVSSTELMIGKIIGAAVTGTIQMAIWLLPVVAVISTAWFALPPEMAFDFTLAQLGYLLFNFFLGLLVFLGLFATVGAIFENAQEAQSGMWPIMMLIIFPFFIGVSMMKNPSNPVAYVASMSPFASIIVMPGRLTLVEVPIWELIVSVIVNIATIFAIFPLAGKIYRVGILRTGKKPTWREVIKWLKYKY
ncbi:MAG: ABC transporter permease [Bacteroidetes bacterium]|nr:ABC transporter permease [Bacteroidota bacterium]